MLTDIDALMEVRMELADLETKLLEQIRQLHPDIKLEDGQSITIEGFITAKDCGITLRLKSRSKAKRIPIERELSEEELEKIAQINVFNLSQRRLVDAFCKNQNKPQTASDLETGYNIIEQVNTILRHRGMLYGLRVESSPRSTFWAKRPMRFYALR